METKTLAWHGDPALKAEVMERLRAHRAADAIVQDIYQRIDPTLALGYRGCAIGCTLPPQPVDNDMPGDQFGAHVVWPDDWHGEVERLYGIPWDVGNAIDIVFETLRPANCGDFAVEVIDAAPVGADLTEVATWVRDELRRYPYGAERVAAELIDRLSTAPVPTPA